MHDQRNCILHGVGLAPTAPVGLAQPPIPGEARCASDGGSVLQTSSLNDSTIMNAKIAKESQRTLEHFAIKVCFGEYVRNFVRCLCNYKVFHKSANMKSFLNHSFLFVSIFLGSFIIHLCRHLLRVMYLSRPFAFFWNSG